MTKRILALALLSTLWLARAQAPVAISPLPGDTVYKDTTQPGDPVYLWWHSTTNTFEIVAPYTQDQVFRLLLSREQACWTTVYWLNRTTATGPTREAAK